MLIQSSQLFSPNHASISSVIALLGLKETWPRPEHPRAYQLETKSMLLMLQSHSSRPSSASR